MSKVVTITSVFMVMSICTSLIWLHYSYVLLKDIPQIQTVSVVDDDLYVQFGESLFKGRLDRLYGRDGFGYTDSNEQTQSGKQSPLIVTSKGYFTYNTQQRQYNLCVQNACTLFKKQENAPKFYDFAANETGFALLDFTSISIYDTQYTLRNTVLLQSANDVKSIKSYYKTFYYLSDGDSALYTLNLQGDELLSKPFLTVNDDAISGFEIERIESFALFYDRVAVLVSTRFSQQKAIVWYDTFGRFIDAKILSERDFVQQIVSYQNYLLLVSPDDYKILIMDKANNFIGLVSWPEIQNLFNAAYEQKLFYERIIPAIMPLTILIVILGVFIVYKTRTTQIKLDFNYDDSSVRV